MSNAAGGQPADAGQSDVAGLLAAAKQKIESKDTRGAIETLERVVASPGCTPDERLEAASLFGSAGDKAKAVASYLDAGLTFLYDIGDMGKARTAFAQAHQLDTSNLDVIFQMGQADVVEGRTQDALAKFIDVLRKSNLKHVPALFEAGCIYQSTAQYDQAILAFKKVLDRDKNHVQALVHMGQLHQTKGMLPESLAYYMQAAEIARESKQFGTAQQLLNMVLALDGGNQKARIMLDDLAEHVHEEDAEAQAADVTQSPSAALAGSPAAAAATGAPIAATPAAPTAESARATQEAAAAVQALTVEREALARQLDELSASRVDIEQAIARLSDDSESATAARDLAQAAKEDAERQLAVLTDTIERQRAQAADAARKKIEAEAELTSTAAALAAAKKELSEISGSADKRRAELEMQLAGLAAQRTQAEAAAAEAGAAAAHAAAERGKIETDVKSQKERGKSDAESLATKRAEAEKAVQAANEAAAAAAAECKRLEAEAKKLEQRNAALQKTKSDEETAAAAAAAKRKESEGSVAALEQQRAKLKEEAEKATAAREKLRAETAAAEAELQTLRERVKTTSANAADAEKHKKASSGLKEVEAAAQTAAARLADSKAALESLEARKREIDEAYAASKSLAAAAEDKRAEAARAADQAEALRAKREADADALAARIAALEASLTDAEARAKLAAGESAALQEVTAKVTAARQGLLDLESRRAELDVKVQTSKKDLDRVGAELAQARAALDEARATAASAPAVTVDAGAVAAPDVSYAESTAASVPPESCAESLRTIESLAAEGEIPFEIAAELAGLIHEGRAVEALRVSRARANMEAAPAPYLLAAGDLSRDLGDAAGARDAYRMMASADSKRAETAHQRIGLLFLTFADRGTAAALQRDDAHFAAAGEPQKALEAYADLVARFPDDPGFRQELGEIHERIGNSGAAGLAYTQAMHGYLGDDDFAKAVELVPKLLRARPDSGEALELAARAFERAGRGAEAQTTLDEALHAYRRAKSAADVERVCRRLAEIADDPVPYRRELASLLQEVGDTSSAAEQLLEAAERLVKWSNGADALSLVKEAVALTGEDEALAVRVAAVKDKASDAQRSIDHAARAAMFLSKKEYEKAAEAYRAAVEKNPYNADACYQLACLLTDRFPDYATAEQLLDNAAELRPGHTATRYRLALVKAARGEVEQAVELLVALARFDEHNADFIEQFVERLEKDADGGAVAAKYRLGIAYRELGRLEEALVILQSIQREPEYIVLCLNAIGLCLRRQGLDTAAAKRFQKAIETAGYPENQYNEALYNLGDLYEAKHDPESLALSLSSFEELYARDCTYRDVTDRIKTVKARLGAAEGPKVKRLPNRSEAANDR